MDARRDYQDAFDPTITETGISADGVVGYSGRATTTTPARTSTG